MKNQSEVPTPKLNYSRRYALNDNEDDRSLIVVHTAESAD
jgi:hypothetical protein